MLEEFAKRHREEEARDAEIDPGEFKRPADWDSARIHTTVTRLFTDPAVFTVYGERFTPRQQASFLMPFHGRLHLVGHTDIDTGIDLDGEYKVDSVDSGRGGPGGAVPGVLRLLWGSEASMVGAIPCGWVRGRVTCAGFGPARASREIRQIEGKLPVTGGVARLTTESGTSVWFPSSEPDGYFDVFLAVDTDRTPVGIILDTSDITQFWWYDDVLEEGFLTEWPADAREFDPEIDEGGTNPNVTLTPPREKEELSVEQLLADDSETEEFTGEPEPITELGLAHGAGAGYTRKRVETSWILTTADGEQRISMGDTATEALDQWGGGSPDDVVVNIKKHYARWVWDF